MKALENMYNPAEVEDFIDDVGRHTPDLRHRAESGKWTQEERDNDPKLDAMCKAVERLAELKTDIASGLRSVDGSLARNTA